MCSKLSIVDFFMNQNTKLLTKKASQMLRNHFYIYNFFLQNLIYGIPLDRDIIINSDWLNHMVAFKFTNLRERKQILEKKRQNVLANGW